MSARDRGKGYKAGQQRSARPPPGLDESAADREGMEMAIDRHRVPPNETEQARYERMMRDAMDKMRALVHREETQDVAEWDANVLHSQACKKVDELRSQLQQAEEAQMRAFSLTEQAEEAREATRGEIIQVAIKMSEYQAKLNSMDPMQ